MNDIIGEILMRDAFVFMFGVMLGITCVVCFGTAPMQQENEDLKNKIETLEGSMNNEREDS